MDWSDTENSMFYLFGGSVDDRANGNYFNDLWVYDSSNRVWAWLSGENGKVSSCVCCYLG
ncbi:hypothetical protein E6Q11_05990 [Candidatus Dojkabacteria bacterium]|uniref:Galactose oxidase n=1 Tax=Candidatus Dojkabacteria bacterium TaxID=2099670 RepID=A0A5C7J3R8_9BACT|nr:MAG: hypothetical protein E6Q11_05990 [Candidatus Dojkabacteria bacterium]